MKENERAERHWEGQRDREKDPKCLGNSVYMSFLVFINYDLKTLPFFNDMGI